MDGLGIKDDSKESKVMIEIVKILDEIADRVESLEDSQLQFEGYLDSINEDLNGLEEGIFEDYCEDDCDLDDFIELECPECGETVYIEEDMLQTHQCIKCPNCQANIISNVNENEERNND
jgi:DNA-directed RNA polymerase subunit delta